MAQGRLAGLFGISPDNIHIRSPFLGGGFGSKGLITGPQVLGIMAARAGRQAGQARAAARADVRPGRPPGADAADLAARYRPRRRADRARSSHQNDVEHVRRFLRAGLQRFAHALCERRHRDLARGGSARHRHAAVHARARRGDRLDRARKRDRRNGARLRDGSAGLPAQELCRGRADFRQAILLKGLARMLSRRAPSDSAGSAAHSRRGRCATRTDSWSAGAWAQRRFRR